MTKEQLILIYGIYLIALSLFTFAIYAIDKNKAKRNARRVSEKFLLTASLLGGAVGGFLAMQLFRHKTKGEHWYFTALNLLGIMIHLALMIYLVFFAPFTTI